MFDSRGTAFGTGLGGSALLESELASWIISASSTSLLSEPRPLLLVPDCVALSVSVAKRLATEGPRSYSKSNGIGEFGVDGLGAAGKFGVLGGGPDGCATGIHGCCRAGVAQPLVSGGVEATAPARGEPSV